MTTIADRPVSHASIESTWGQQVHDYTFAPAGCVAGGGYRSVTTSLTLLAIDTASSDPGGYADTANDRIVVPTNGEGLYTISSVHNSDTGTTGRVRVYLFLNGSELMRSTEDSITGSVVTVTLSGHLQLTAGDVITFYGQRVGSGANPRVACVVSLIRLGVDYGAPT